MTSLKLSYWVYDTDVSLIFPVMVLDIDNVVELKSAIEQTPNPAVRGILPPKLALYSIPMPENDDDDEKLTEAMRHWTPEGKLRLAGVRRPLSSLNLTHSLIIVCVPNLPAIRDVITVTCWILGDDASHIFHLDMHPTDRVGKLKKVICDMNPVACHDVNIGAITLYKVSLPPGDLEGTFADLDLDKGEPLCPRHTISGVSSEDFDVAIDIPGHPPAHPPLPLLVDDIRTQRLEFLDSNEPMAPSSAGTTGKFSSRQKDDDRTIYCNRPAGAVATIPVTLLHPVFSQFLDDCRTHEIIAEDNALAMELSIAMSNFYTIEKNRAETIRAILVRQGLPFTVSKTDQGYQTDGDILVNGHRCAISQFKNEVSGSGAEPYNQAILYYLELTRESAIAMTKTCLPCMLIIVFGPYVVFAGVAWNLRPTAQILSIALAMHYHPTDTNMRVVAARHLGAFKKAIRKLEAYYRDIAPLSAPLLQAPSRQHLFPYPTYFYSPRAHREDFEYTFQPFDDKLLFFATLSDKRDVCVKFTRRYSEGAHRKCASLGFAPALHAVEMLPGGWIMVVMDRLMPEEYSLLSKSRVSPELIDTIRDRLKQLHGEGLVHGDVRDLNIMVSRTDQTKFMLIDFDWAGESGEVCYPMNVNRIQIWRPFDVEDDRPILPQHDMAMLDRIGHDYLLRSLDDSTE